MPGAEHLDIPEVKDVEYLPKGIMKGRDCKGGSDSLFESLWYGLNDLVKDGYDATVSKSISELRIFVMAKAIKNPEGIGIKKVRRYVKEINAMKQPGIPVFQETLSAAIYLFRVVVFVCFGGQRPLV